MWSLSTSRWMSNLRGEPAMASRRWKRLQLATASCGSSAGSTTVAATKVPGASPANSRHVATPVHTCRMAVDAAGVPATTSSC